MSLKEKERQMLHCIPTPVPSLILTTGILVSHALPTHALSLSSGSFHLIRLLFDEYVLYLIENLHMESLVGELMVHTSVDRALPLEPSDSFFPGSLSPSCPHARTRTLTDRTV